MEQKIYSFPYFVANQILKSKDLNDSFGYLDEQARMTRAKLLGFGVLDGLSFSIEKGVLIINPGTALNSRGWMYSVPHETAYRYVAKAKVGDLPFKNDTIDGLLTSGNTSNNNSNYYCFKTEEEALELGFTPIPLSSLKTNQMVLCIAFGTRTKTRACSESSCDVYLGNKNVEMLPVLTQYSSAVRTHPVFRLTPLSITPVPSKEKFNTKYLNKDYVLHTIKEYFWSRRKKVMEIANSIWYNVFAQSTTIDTAKLATGPFVNLAPEYNSILSRFRTAFLKINAMKVREETQFIPDYYLNFLEDIHFALNEFLEEYNLFADKYRYIPNTAFSDNALVYLGAFNNTYKDVSRSRYFNINDECFRHDVSRLFSFLERIAAMSERFIGPSMNQGKAFPRSTKLIAEAPFSRISVRPIPAYYDQTDSFVGLWHIDDKYSRRKYADYPYEPRLKKAGRVILLILIHPNIRKHNNNDEVYLSGYEEIKSGDMPVTLTKPQSNEINKLTGSGVVLPNIKVSRNQWDFLKNSFFTEQVSTLLAENSFKDPMKSRDSGDNVRLLYTAFSNLLNNYSIYSEMIDTILGGGFPTLDNLSRLYTQLEKVNKTLEEKDIKDYANEVSKYLMTKTKGSSVHPRFINDYRQRLASALSALFKYVMIYNSSNPYDNYTMGGILVPGYKFACVRVKLKEEKTKNIFYLTELAPER